ncbi:restriction endonuclease subunit S [Pediococcus acidilactici]|uniref:restriction endonuclease subunit S n=1 Tax=Pediococcus acidilactici TaxID=1254 RepID=UPI003EBE4D37
MSEEKNVPNIRFKGFTDPWEQRKLGDFSDVRDGTHASPKYISHGHPMVTSKNLTNSGLDMTNVLFLTDEDFNKINKRSKVNIGDILLGMIGTIGNPVIVDRDDFAIKNVALIKEKNSGSIVNRWLLQYLKSPSFNRFIQKENAGGTQKFIALGLIRDMKLKVPGLTEQVKIGQFFKQLDDTIALHQQKVTQLKELKKLLMQKIFDQEWRFRGFTDPWVQRKLGDEVQNIHTGTNLLGSKENDGIPLLKMGNIQRGFFSLNKLEFLDKNDTPRINDFVKYGDFFFNTRNTLELVGKGATWVKKDNNYVFNSNIAKVKFKSLNTIFFNYLYNTLNFINQVHSKAVGTTSVAAVYPRDLYPIKFYMPNSMEQKSIGSLFKKLDDLIALHQQKVDQLKELKKYLMQNLFV